jgi:hypothetical protein
MQQMSNNEFIIEAIKGENNSLTSIAFHTGVIVERERIIKLINNYRQLSPTALIRMIREESK